MRLLNATEPRDRSLRGISVRMVQGRLLAIRPLYLGKSGRATDTQRAIVVFQAELSLAATEAYCRDRWLTGRTCLTGQHWIVLLCWRASADSACKPGIVFLAYQSLSGVAVRRPPNLSSGVRGRSVV